jgi:hypothetical protein
MNVLTRLKDMAVSLEKKNNSIFDYPVEKQSEYLDKFKDPKDDIERSYYQYRCQMKLNHPTINFLLNMASLPMIILYLKKKATRIGTNNRADAVFFADGKPENIIPISLKRQYSSWEVINEKGEYLSKMDKKYLKKLWLRYPFSWHFLLKCLIKIRFYSYELATKEPKVIVVCNEYSFTSSVLTNYCESKNIKHINVMHGEKLYYMRDSFFHFHQCYVWNEHYAALFRSLRAENTQFVIAVPESLKFVKIDVPKTIDFTYYLGAEDGETLEHILHSLNQLSHNKNNVAIRPHPRYSDVEKIKKMCCKDMEVEDGQTLTIETSVLRTRYAISGYSTVLNQAYHNGTKVVIDDITNPESFRKLVELKYVMLETEHKLLSEILEENR